jgi:hypothetical protein
MVAILLCLIIVLPGVECKVTVLTSFSAVACLDGPRRYRTGRNDAFFFATLLAIMCASSARTCSFFKRARSSSQPVGGAKLCTITATHAHFSADSLDS